MSNPIPLEPSKYYHVYNRGNNRENIFIEERNYIYFLKLYAHHIQPIAETFAYCLLKNHFHFLIRVKNLTGLEDLSGLEDPSGLGDLSGLEHDPSQAFSNFFNAYSKAINKAYQRTGALFQRPFGRIEVTSDAYFKQLVIYIHQNPQKHKFVNDFREWKYSSYHALIATQATHLKRDEIIGWFDNATGFMNAHQQLIGENEVSALAPEDFD